jgi:hypothetical protein
MYIHVTEKTGRREEVEEPKLGWRGLVGQGGVSVFMECDWKAGCDRRHPRIDSDLIWTRALELYIMYWVGMLQ